MYLEQNSQYGLGEQFLADDF